MRQSVSKYNAILNRLAINAGAFLCSTDAVLHNTVLNDTAVDKRIQHKPLP